MAWGRRSIVAGVLAAVGALGACTSPPLVHFPEADGSVVSTAEPDVVGPIRMVGQDLVDATGRVVLIHGTNSVRKSEPFISPLEDGWLGPADLASIRADGFNGVRLGVWAAALVPEPGVIDTAYLDRVGEVVGALEAQHLWVLLDFHQDVFWGMPSWATTPAAAALSDRAPDELAGIGWAAAYASPRSVRQWEDWWADVPSPDGRGMVEAYGDGVAAVAERFRGSPNVIGIDLLNEPFAGEKFLECVLASCPERWSQVARTFRSLTDRVRQVAPDMAVWWEPFTFGLPFPDTAAPGPGVGYSFHAYCLGTDGGEPEAPPPAAVAFCDEVFAGTFNAASHIGTRWDAPVLLGEFGASASPLNATAAARLADQHLFSWMHWHHGDHPEVVRTQLVRAYAQATAGRPTSQAFDPASGAFRFRYVPDHAVTAPTSIVLPPAVYPRGYEVEVDGGEVTSPPDAGRLTVVADEGATEVAIKVSRVR